LLKLEGDQVTFSYKDYAQEGHPQKERKVSAEQLFDLFLQHVSPKGFKRVRYVGFWAGSHASQRIASIHQQITGDSVAEARRTPQENASCGSDSTNHTVSIPSLDTATPAITQPTCPHCGSVDLQLIDVRERYQCDWMWSLQWDLFPSWRPQIEDTS
jgi:hypothetical protein